ncbi:MAG: hypothetical protein ACTS3F_10285 [Phycisphaerales bacterium]
MTEDQSRTPFVLITHGKNYSNIVSSLFAFIDAPDMFCNGTGIIAPEARPNCLVSCSRSLGDFGFSLVYGEADPATVKKMKALKKSGQLLRAIKRARRELQPTHHDASDQGDTGTPAAELECEFYSGDGVLDVLLNNNGYLPLYIKIDCRRTTEETSAIIRAIQLAGFAIVQYELIRCDDVHAAEPDGPTKVRLSHHLKCYAPAPVIERYAGRSYQADELSSCAIFEGVEWASIDAVQFSQEPIDTDTMLPILVQDDELISGENSKFCYVIVTGGGQHGESWKPLPPIIDWIRTTVQRDDERGQPATPRLARISYRSIGGQFVGIFVLIDNTGNRCAALEQDKAAFIERNSFDSRQDKHGGIRHIAIYGSERRPDHYRRSWQVCRLSLTTRNREGTIAALTNHWAGTWNYAGAFCDIIEHDGIIEMPPPQKPGKRKGKPQDPNFRHSYTIVVNPSSDAAIRWLNERNSNSSAAEICYESFRRMTETFIKLRFETVARRRPGRRPGRQPDWSYAYAGDDLEALEAHFRRRKLHTEIVTSWKITPRGPDESPAPSKSPTESSKD